jgi:uncharacterized membrane protein
MIADSIYLAQYNRSEKRNSRTFNCALSLRIPRAAVLNFPLTLLGEFASGLAGLQPGAAADI